VDLAIRNFNFLLRPNTDWLIRSDVPVREFVHKLHAEKEQYDGFNVILGTVDELWYFGNRDEGDKPVLLEKGKVSDQIITKCYFNYKYHIEFEIIVCTARSCFKLIYFCLF
jgi:hypothetical protein